MTIRRNLIRRASSGFQLRYASILVMYRYLVIAMFNKASCAFWDILNRRFVTFVEFNFFHEPA